jgi:tetratricopeptide (TPR) repeat protein
MSESTELPQECRVAFDLAMATEWKNEAARERALADAVETFQEALTREPANPRLWMHLGELQLDRGASREARRAFKQVLRLEPEDTLAHSGLAYACSEMGRHAEAERLLRRAVELEPTDLLYGQLAALLIAQDRLEEAAEPLRAGLQLAPENPELLFLFARYMAEDPGEARGALERALCADPENLEALFDLGGLFASEGEYGRAAACFTRMTELEPDDSEAWRELAVLALHDDLPRALELAERAVALDPLDPRALRVLSEALWQGGQRERALNCLAQATTQRPLDAEIARAHWTQAQFLEQQGQLDEALLTLYEVDAFIPSWPAIAADLGRLNLLQGDRARAGQYLQMALEHDTEDQASRELLRSLDAPRAGNGGPSADPRP